MSVSGVDASHVSGVAYSRWNTVAGIVDNGLQSQRRLLPRDAETTVCVTGADDVKSVADSTPR